MDKSNKNSYSRINIFDVRSRHLAEQMTFKYSKMFQRIDLAELLKWAEKQEQKACPNLVREGEFISVGDLITTQVNFTEHFNKLSYWVRTMVLRPKDHKDRERYYTKCIKVMKHLRTMGNYNSYLSVLSALDSGPVRRLSWSRELLDTMSEHTSAL